ncbi:unnamed protein product [Mytilus coruscus]|uniref:Uncharacterized protein n=1 Tax=Mytilus coruscus TaxID=42192 RepID=A0A6J8E0Z1_MYTCO|nr:unnamed protein product [Mytilus coruscus]
MVKNDWSIKTICAVVGILHIIFIFRTFQTNDRIIHLFSVGKFETNVNKIQLKVQEKTTTVSKEKSLLTLFTSWVPDKEKYLCRNNTINNWNLLHENVSSILFTNDTDLSRRVSSMGWKVLPVSKVGATGVPVLKDMFYASFAAHDSEFYAYANGDILFTNDLIDTIKAVIHSNIGDAKDLLLIGKRYDVRHVSADEATNFDKLKETVIDRGKLHNAWGIDYFIMRKSYPLQDYPDLVIGRPLVDTYLVSEAVNRPHSHVVDITKTSPTVHQVTLPGSAGIREGMSKLDNLYNFKILENEKWNQFSGLTVCAQYFTTLSRNMKIRIKKRGSEGMFKRCHIHKKQAKKKQKQNKVLNKLHKKLKDLNLRKRNNNYDLVF